MKLDETVLEVLSSIDVIGNRVKITQGQLDRKLYVKVDQALQALGGKWSRAFRAHVFDDDPRDRIDTAIVAGEVVHAAKDFGFFPTPASIATEVIKWAGVVPGMFVLEPSAGRGGLAFPVRDVGAFVTCIEILDQNIAYLRQVFHDGVHHADFLTLTPKTIGVYDRVVMNPPFSCGQDVAHVTHALQFARPGGKVVSVMSAGFVFRQDQKTRDLRTHLIERRGEIVPLPDGSFKDAGTEVRTVIAVIPT